MPSDLSNARNGSLDIDILSIYAFFFEIGETGIMLWNIYNLHRKFGTQYGIGYGL